MDFVANVGRSLLNITDYTNATSLVDYTPSANVENFHNIPRFYGGNDFNYTDEDYIGGVVMTGFFFILFGFLFFVLVPVCFLVKSCASACNKKSDQLKEKPMWLRLGYLIALGMVFIGVVIGFEGNENASESADKVGNLMLKTAGYIDEATWVVDSVDLTVNQSRRDLNRLDECALFASSPDSAELHAALDTLEDAVNDYHEGVGNFSDELRVLVDELEESDQSRYDGTVSILSFILFLLFVSFVSVGLAVMCKFEWLPKLAGFFVLPALWLFACFAWEIAGISMMMGAGGGDFCIDPAEALIEMAAASNYSDEAAFVITCTGEDPFEAGLIQIQQQIDYVIGNVTEARENTGLMTVCASVDPDTVLQDLANSIAGAYPIIDDAAYLVECPRLNSFYVDMFDDLLCTSSMDGLALTFTGSFIIAFFLPFILLTYYQQIEVAHGKKEHNPNLEMVQVTPVAQPAQAQ